MRRKTINWTESLYYQHFRSCMRGMLFQSRVDQRKPYVSMMFAQHPEIGFRPLATYFDSVKLLYGDRIKDFAAGDSKRFAQLQAADIVANVLSAEVAGLTLSPYAKAARQMFERKHPYFSMGGNAKLYVLDKYDGESVNE